MFCKTEFGEASETLEDEQAQCFSVNEDIIIANAKFKEHKKIVDNIIERSRIKEHR